ncbi:SDR family oxidoreductase [Rhizobacter sp. J219]|uniref:SDR family NAD(P)-dependent oxidoreductase n=1 Tax=Rhizobacter sp. J219 TaxID=2898430 RepID=UPI002151915D|nr:SDR family oxidoreductase [Rhizobacter sp. J219]MCR5885467.1 SDR family oxidoreductase [Rhizobacter sp. J219]
MGSRLQGKVAVITGATSGIGEATARKFAAEGASVVIAGRSVERGEALARELGANVLFKATDVMHEADIAALVDAAVQRFGRLDCMFNNAGGNTPGTLDDVTEQQVDYAMKLLYGSALFGIKHAARVMRPQGGGSIINNSSIAAHRLAQGAMLYSCAKAAVSHLTRLMGVQLGPDNIRVNSISPGAIATPIFWGGAATATDEVNAKRLAKLQQNLAHATPTPRSGLADDIANAALFLASDEGSFVNCHDLVVDGGRIWQFNERPREAAAG